MSTAEKIVAYEPLFTKDGTEVAYFCTVCKRIHDEPDKAEECCVHQDRRKTREREQSDERMRRIQIRHLAQAIRRRRIESVPFENKNRVLLDDHPHVIEDAGMLREALAGRHGYQYDLWLREEVHVAVPVPMLIDLAALEEWLIEAHEMDSEYIALPDLPGWGELAVGIAAFNKAQAQGRPYWYTATSTLVDISSVVKDAIDDVEDDPEKAWAETLAAHKAWEEETLAADTEIA